MSKRVISFALGALALLAAGCAPVVYDGYYPPPYSASVTYYDYDGHPGPRHYHDRGWHDDHHRYWR